MYNFTCQATHALRVLHFSFHLLISATNITYKNLRDVETHVFVNQIIVEVESTEGCAWYTHTMPRGMYCSQRAESHIGHYASG